MPISDARRRANEKWNAKNIVKVGCNVSRSLHDQFKKACEAQGDTMHSVLRDCIENYVVKYKEVNQ